LYVFPGDGQRVVLFDVASGKELVVFWRASGIAYPVGKPARRVAGLAGAIALAATLRTGGDP
jgi:hypothetical protein